MCRDKIASAQFRLGMVILVMAAVFVPTMRAQGAARFTVFGEDDRFQITDTRQYPWSAVAQLRIYWSADDLVGNSCTGWMIGPSALATAAHCIYNGSYPQRVVVKPGMNADADNQTPFGTCEVINGVVPQAWIEQRDIRYDYGVYHLDCAIGNQTGILNFKMTPDDWTQQSVQVTGYPKDKPGRTMWSGVGRTTGSDAKGLYYDADMRPGQSGAPVWDAGDEHCRYCVVAINSSEFGAPAMNFGARIDREAFDFLQSERSFSPDQPRED